jgi:hypothetical protein
MGGSGRRHSLRKSSQSCLHVYLEEWEEGYRCIDCKIPITELARVKQEQEWKKSIYGEDEKLYGSREERILGALNRGVTIRWLLDFTTMHDCWLMPTWLVRRNFIIPATAATRCRYVDLPELREASVVGKAMTYVSHCWGAPWGALVTAVCSGAVDPDRRIWCDLFAMRQWPSLESLVTSTAESSLSPGLDYRDLIKRCPSFLLCCSARPSHRLNSTADPLAGDTKNILSLCRTWCLVELHTAIRAPNTSIIIRCGAYQRPSFLSAQHTFRTNTSLLERLASVIDLSLSIAGSESERKRLIKDVEECPGGVEGLDSLVKGVIKGTLLCSALCTLDDTLYHAVCGDASALHLMTTQSVGQSLVQASAGGYLLLAKDFVAKGAGVDSKCLDYTPLLVAAAGGHLETVKYLLSLGASVETTHPTTGNTPLACAASNGFHETVNLLLLSGAVIDSLNTSQQTPLMLAAENGHTHTVTFLLSRGAHINHHDSKGSTSLHLATTGGHLSTVKVLLSKGALKSAKNLEGYSAVALAEKLQQADCLTLLTETR